MLSIVGILLSAQQIAVLDLLASRYGEGKPASSKAGVRSYLPLLLTEVKRSERETYVASDEIGTWKPRWKMVFTWQCPIMFLAYSVVFFLAGLTIFVCTPLIRRNPWGTDSNVSQFPYFCCELLNRRMELLTNEERSPLLISLFAPSQQVPFPFALFGSTIISILKMMTSGSTSLGL